MQVSTLVYSMGAQAEDVLACLTLTEKQRTKYADVKAGLDGYFVKKRNVIFERAKFNQRRQTRDEPVETFITALYSLAEHCEFGTLREELIRDRLVVGLRDAKLSEALQMDSDLTLSTAITNSRQSEAVKEQQTVVRNELPLESQKSTELEAAQIRRVKRSLTGQRKSKPAHFQASRVSKKQTSTPGSTCQRCGAEPTHGRERCPAINAKCHKCGKLGHYARVCKTKKVSTVFEDQGSGEFGDLFSLSNESMSKQCKAWMVQVTLDGVPVVFKIDSGADVTVIPESMFGNITTKLQPTGARLRGPGDNVLRVRGKFTARLQYRQRSSQQEVYVVRDVERALLGWPAIESLQLLKRIDSAARQPSRSVQEEFPQLFQGLGKLEGEYEIKLKENATPFALSTPRRVPLPLMKEVETKLERMLKEGVISQVETPTDWCSGIVVVPKSGGRVRICVDLSRLNESVCRERLMLPSVDYTLGQLAGAKVFTKLDANSGFWQIPLSKNSALLTTFITPFGRFCFNRLPFGISSAPELFQRRMSNLLTGMGGTVCLMDDILIYGSSQEEHDARLCKVLEKLRKSGVTLNREKCCVFCSKNKVVGTSH